MMFFLLSMRNSCHQGKTPARSRLSYRATGRETAPYLYPLSPAKLGVLRGYTQENLAKGLTRPSKSPSGALLLFSPKKDGILASALITE